VKDKEGQELGQEKEKPDNTEIQKVHNPAPGKVGVEGQGTIATGSPEPTRLRDEFLPGVQLLRG
jgi:hypothetical protein